MKKVLFLTSLVLALAIGISQSSVLLSANEGDKTNPCPRKGCEDKKTTSVQVFGSNTVLSVDSLTTESDTLNAAKPCAPNSASGDCHGRITVSKATPCDESSGYCDDQKKPGTLI